jgi:hypothetical protein
MAVEELPKYKSIRCLQQVAVKKDTATEEADSE